MTHIKVKAMKLPRLWGEPFWLKMQAKFWPRFMLFVLLWKSMDKITILKLSRFHCFPWKWLIKTSIKIIGDWAKPIKKVYFYSNSSMIGLLLLWILQLLCITLIWRNLIIVYYHKFIIVNSKFESVLFLKTEFYVFHFFWSSQPKYFRQND